MQLIIFNMQLIYLDNRDTYVNIKHIHVNLMHMDVLMLLVNNTKLHVSQIAERSIVLKMINTNRLFFRLLTNIGIGSHKAKKAASIYSINCRTAGYRMSKNTMARCPDTHNWLKYSFWSMAGCKAGMSVWLDCLYVLNVRIAGESIWDLRQYIQRNNQKILWVYSNALTVLDKTYF